MDAISYLRDSLKWAHEIIANTVADCTQVQADWIPPGNANPLGATYAHAILLEDGFVNGVVRGVPTLFTTTWADKTGVSDPQVRATFEWARSVRVDLAALGSYAVAVAAATDAWMAQLTPDDLSHPLDLTGIGLGHRTLGWGIHALVIGHLHNMTGEISCLKGLQGAQGYPF